MASHRGRCQIACVLYAVSLVIAIDSRSRGWPEERRDVRAENGACDRPSPWPHMSVAGFQNYAAAHLGVSPPQTQDRACALG